MSKKSDTNKKDKNISLEDLIAEEAVKRFKEGKIKNASDVSKFMDKLYQPIMQKLLDAELDIHLQYSKYEHSKDKNTISNNTRNGHCKTKKVKTEYGNIEVQTPRDRNATFEPIITGTISFVDTFARSA